MRPHPYAYRNKKRRRKKSQDLIATGFIMTFSFVLCIILVLLIHKGVLGFGRGSGGSGYLYNPPPPSSFDSSNKKEETLEDVFPIMEYIAPTKTKYETDNRFQQRVTHPDFLYSNDNGPRVVEFYSPWCGVSVIDKKQGLETCVCCSLF